jgi:sigma-B regulation protein RsbU (phosphoserine phosphatase)
MTRLSSMIPVYRTLERKHPDLVFWQLATLKNGIHTIYPALRHRPMMYDGLRPDWYHLAKEKNRMVWSIPSIDPLTGQMSFTVSTPILLPDGESIGVTAMVVPVSVLLKEDEHIQDNGRIEPI